MFDPNMLTAGELNSERHTLYTDGYELETALDAAPLAVLELLGCEATGAIELVSESGWEVLELWVTDSSRPFDLAATYYRVR